MHPINKLNFGAATGQIKVSYHNGASVVTGYILKQVGTSKFVVTTNGTAKFTRKLSKAATPAAGEMTIVVKAVVNGSASGSDEHVKKITARHVSTVEGNEYIWCFPTALPAANVTGYAAITVN